MTIFLGLPDWQQGPVSGGHRYNRALADALKANALGAGALADAGAGLQRLDLESPSASATLAAAPAGSVVIVDTLYQRAFEALSPDRCPRAILLVHLLSEMTGDPCYADAEPWPWLGRYDHFLVTGSYAKDYLIACGVSSCAITVIEPPLWPREVTVTPRLSAKPLTWLTVANLQPVKQQWQMLTALQKISRSRETYHNQPFTWQLYGSHDYDPAYAAKCRELVASCPLLSTCVEFYPNKPAAEAEQALLAADLVLSAARCETYGMAVAEAAVLGTPVIAVARGNVPHLLSGGPSYHRLVATAAEVIDAAPSFEPPPSLTPMPLGHSQQSFSAAVAAFARKVLL